MDREGKVRAMKKYDCNTARSDCFDFISVLTTNKQT